MKCLSPILLLLFSGSILPALGQSSIDLTVIVEGASKHLKERYDPGSGPKANQSTYDETSAMSPAYAVISEPLISIEMFSVTKSTKTNTDEHKDRISEIKVN